MNTVWIISIFICVVVVALVFVYLVGIGVAGLSSAYRFESRYEADRIEPDDKNNQ